MPRGACRRGSPGGMWGDGVFLSLQLLPCCRESDSVWLQARTQGHSVSSGAKPVANKGVTEGVMAWQSKGHHRKGCAMPCPGNVSMPEMDGGSGVLIHPAWRLDAQPGQPPAGASTCERTLGTGNPELLAPRLKGQHWLFLRRAEMPLLVNERE